MRDIKDRIASSQNIIITGHINPDGDAVGAGLALMLGLRATYCDKIIDFVLQDELPNNMKFLKGSDEIKKLEDAYKTTYDLAIFVDSATLDRVGEIKNITKDIFKINIDHHISNTRYADINIVKDISSTSELIYSLLKELGITITLDMAQAIYLGIINDTGNFSHSNVTANTFMVASELIKIGVNSNYIINCFFKSKSLERLKVLGKALSEMIFIADKKLMYFFLSYDETVKMNLSKGDTEGIVEELLNYRLSEVSLFLREDEKGDIKGSLRSKNDRDVNNIANLFGGGGHIKAAGFSSKKSVEQIVKKIIDSM